MPPGTRTWPWERLDGRTNVSEGPCVVRRSSAFRARFKKKAPRIPNLHATCKSQVPDRLLLAPCSVLRAIAVSVLSGVQRTRIPFVLSSLPPPLYRVVWIFHQLACWFVLEYGSAGEGASASREENKKVTPRLLLLLLRWFQTFKRSTFQQTALDLIFVTTHRFNVPPLLRIRLASPLCVVLRVE